jgi:hypothetical protein
MLTSNYFDYFEVIYCINLDCRNDRWEAVQREFAKVGILDRVIRFSAVETPENGHLGCRLSHRAIIQRAKDEGWKNVLVFEDDVELENWSWQLFTMPTLDFDILYLGGIFSWPRLKMTSWNDYYWKIHRWLYGAIAIAYSQSIYDAILQDIAQYLPFDGLFAQKLQKKYLCIMPKLSPVNLFGATYSDTDAVKKGIFFVLINRIGYFTARQKWIPYMCRFILMGWLTKAHDLYQKLCKKYQKYFIKSGSVQNCPNNSKNTKKHG